MLKSTVNHSKRTFDNCKLLFGHAVKKEKVYSDVVLLHSNEREINTPLQALLYENGRLLLASEDRKYFVFLTGDIAAYDKKIYAERIVTSIRFNQPVTAQTDVITLKDKYHFVPPCLIDAIFSGVALKKLS